MMPHGGNRMVVAKLRILRLTVMNSGTYNQMYFRPYETHFDADISDSLTRRLNDNRGQSAASLMVGVAERIMMPAHQHYGEVPIVNGWQQPRGRFNLVVEVSYNNGTTQYYNIQGYTDHYDTSHTGQPDPNMVFYINSYTRTSRSMVSTPTGFREQEMVTETAQVINGRLAKSMMGNNDLYGMRPNEIYSVMQADYFRDYSNEYDMQTLADPRQMLSSSAVPSKRSNNLPSNIVSNMINSWSLANSTNEFGNDRADVYGRSKGYVTDGYLIDNPFFRQISSITGIPDTTSFRLRDLVAIDPGVSDSRVTTFFTLDSRGMMQLNQAGQTSTWHDPSDVHAWACSVIINAVPAIMMEMMLTHVAFTANNHDSAGINHVIITGAKDLLGRDIRENLEFFKQRFIHEVMYGLTYGNSETYSLTANINLMGDTVIDIKIGNNPLARFCAPSFCDSLIAPIVTPNEQVLRHNVDDISQMLRGITTNIPTNSMVNLTI